MSRDILKATVTLTVLLPADEKESLDKRDLQDLLWQIDEGTWIGGNLTIQAEPIEGEELTETLLQMGNDGSFFEDEDYVPRDGMGNRLDSLGEED